MNIQLIICLIIFAFTIAGFIQTKVSRGTVALLAMLALVIFQCITPEEALKGFSNSTAIFMASMFIVSEGFSRTKAIGSFARAVGRISKGSFTKIMAGYIIMTFFLTTICGSSSAAFAIAMPMVLSICNELGFDKSKMLFPVGMISICCTQLFPIGGSATLYATFNGYIESFGITDYNFTIFEPMLGRLPGAIIICIYAILIAPKLCPNTGAGMLETTDSIETKKQKELPLFQERAGLIVFVLTVFAILIKDYIGIEDWIVALLGALLMIATGVLKPKEAYHAASVGGIVMMYIGILGIAVALTNTGAGEMIGKGIASMIGNTHNGYIIGAVFFIIPFILTQFLNNRAVNNIFIPIAIMTCQSLGCNAEGAIILVTAGGLSAFMTPMATATVSMYMQLGGYSQKDLIKMSIPPAVILMVVNVAWVMTIFPAF